MKLETICVLMSSLSMVVGCAGTPQKVDQGQLATPIRGASNDINNEAGKSAKADYFVEITFREGRTELTESASRSITSLINRAQQGGKLEEIKILSWGDYEYPSESTKKLSKAQTELADKRNTKIEKFIKSFKKVDADIDTYNMAVRPTALAKLFDTSDAKIKATMVAAGLPTTADSSQNSGKASRSVILVTIE